MKRFVGLLCIVLVALCLSGCVERQLTIKTVPEGATVLLNDEEIGQTPVTVPFNWYGFYRIEISKPNYETLKTQRKLEAPLHDYFPFDFFAQIWPERHVDSYEWTFDLKQKEHPSPEEVIRKAEKLATQLQ